MVNPLRWIANVFSGNGKEDEITVEPEKIDRKNVDRVTSKLKKKMIKARVELECVKRKLDGESVACSD